MIEKFKDFIKQDFLKKVLVLFSGNFLCQIIGFAILPILTRLFSDELFGVFALYSSGVILLRLIATLNYEDAILLPKKNTEAINVLAFAFIITTTICSVFFFVIYILEFQILNVLKIHEIGKFIYLLPLGVFISSIIVILEYWNNRMNHFKNISISLLSKTSFQSLSQIATGFSAFKVYGLVPGALLGQFISFLVLLKLSYVSIIKNIKHVNFSEMLILVKKYKDVLLFNTILSFLDTLSNEVPLYLITRFFGLSTSGVYGVSQKVSKAPLGAVGSSVNQVFFNTASKLYNHNIPLYNLLIKTYKGLLGTSMLIYIPVFISSFYFDWIFGNNWHNTGLYVRIFIPWYFITFLNSPVSSILIVLKKQRVFIKYEVLLLFARAIVIYVGAVLYNSILVSVSLLSIAGVLYNLFCVLYFISIAKSSHKIKY